MTYGLESWRRHVPAPKPGVEVVGAVFDHERIRFGPRLRTAPHPDQLPATIHFRRTEFGPARFLKQRVCRIPTERGEPTQLLKCLEHEPEILAPAPPRSGPMHEIIIAVLTADPRLASQRSNEAIGRATRRRLAPGMSRNLRRRRQPPAGLEDFRRSRWACDEVELALVPRFAAVEGNDYVQACPGGQNPPHARTTAPVPGKPRW